MPARRTYRAWTGAEIDALAGLRGEGRTVRQIAEALGRSPGSVVGMLSRRDREQLAPGGFPRPVRSARWWRWVDELKVARPEAEHAARMGCSRQRVKCAKRELRRAGVAVAAIPRCDRGPGARAEARRLRGEGLTLRAIAARLGASHAWAYRVTRHDTEGR